MNFSRQRTKFISSAAFGLVFLPDLVGKVPAVDSLPHTVSLLLTYLRVTYFKRHSSLIQKPPAPPHGVFNEICLNKFGSGLDVGELRNLTFLNEFNVILVIRIFVIIVRTSELCRRCREENFVENQYSRSTVGPSPASRSSNLHLVKW